MRNAGENFARLWMAPWFAGLEHTPGTLNRYNLEAAWQLDYVFDLAGQNGIYLMLSFDHHGMFQVNNQNWGGSNNFGRPMPTTRSTRPVRKAQRFLHQCQGQDHLPETPALSHRPVRYSPHLLAWQFFNEIDNVFGSASRR